MSETYVSVEHALALADATPAGSGRFLAQLFAAARAAGVALPAILAWIVAHQADIQKALSDIMAGASVAAIIADLVALMR